MDAYTGTCIYRCMQTYVHPCNQPAKSFQTTYHVVFHDSPHRHQSTSPKRHHIDPLDRREAWVGGGTAPAAHCTSNCQEVRRLLWGRGKDVRGFGSQTSVLHYSALIRFCSTIRFYDVPALQDVCVIVG